MQEVVFKRVPNSWGPPKITGWSLEVPITRRLSRDTVREGRKNEGTRD